MVSIATNPFHSLAFQVEMPPFVQILIPHLKAHCKGTYIPPEVASRTVQAPFLFKCCRVGYNKEANRLEIRKGEYVGKTITAALGNETTMQDAAYGDSLPVEICIGEDGELEGKNSRCLTAIDLTFSVNRLNKLKEKNLRNMINL